MLRLQDFLAAVVALMEDVQPTSLAQIRAQTKVNILNYCCGSTGQTKGTPEFFNVH